jgi:rhodanese-related sulfurtransferase
MSSTTSLIIFAVVILIFFLLKRSGQVPAKDVPAFLQEGAMVIDVRSPAEFDSRHLPKAINIPLDTIETALPRRVQDKNRVLLLHCQSGMRSGVASKKLKQLGYVRAFNLGSYSRAAKLLSGH